MAERRVPAEGGVGEPVVSVAVADAFARDGVACVRQVFDAGELADATAAIEAVLADPSPLTQVATVNEALRRVVQAETRRRHLQELAAGALPDLSDPDIMQAAWQ
jgi:hypothetical protein